MDKLIKAQLNMCKTHLPDWSDDTTHMVIPSQSGKVFNNDISVGDKFMINIENYIIHEPPNFTLSEQWNGGTTPPENEMDVSIIDIKGKMYKVSGTGQSSKIEWVGWLPRKGFQIIR